MFTLVRIFKSYLVISFFFSLPSHFFPLPSLSSHFHFSTLPSEETKEKKRNFQRALGNHESIAGFFEVYATRTYQQWLVVVLKGGDQNLQVRSRWPMAEFRAS